MAQNVYFSKQRLRETFMVVFPRCGFAFLSTLLKLVVTTAQQSPSQPSACGLSLLKLNQPSRHGHITE